MNMTCDRNSFALKALTALLSVSLVWSLAPVPARAETAAAAVTAKVGEETSKGKSAATSSTEDVVVADLGPHEEFETSSPNSESGSEEEHSKQDVQAELVRLVDAFAKRVKEESGENPDEASVLRVLYTLLAKETGELDAPLETDADAAALAALSGEPTTAGGVARAFCLTAAALEIEAIEVGVEDGSCVWNMVCIDGAWYHVDVAVAARAYRAAREADEGASVAEDWLLIGDDSIRRLDSARVSWRRVIPLEDGSDEAPPATGRYARAESDDAFVDDSKRPVAGFELNETEPVDESGRVSDGSKTVRSPESGGVVEKTTEFGERSMVDDEASLVKSETDNDLNQSTAKQHDAVSVSKLPMPPKSNTDPLLTLQMSQSDYDSKVNSFISDGRWRHGVWWGSNQTTKIAPFTAYACFAYACDFTYYMYGVNNYERGAYFGSASDVRAGDVIRAGGHTFVVLGRNGNSLWTAEGNYSSSVRIANPGYTISGNGFSQVGSNYYLGFQGGYHFEDIVQNTNPIPGPILGRSYVDVPPGDFVIRSAIGGKVLDIDGSHLSENGANAQLWEDASSDNKVFRIEWDAERGGYAIRLKKSGRYLDAEGGSSATVANVIQWDWATGPNQRWLFQDAGDGWVYIRNLNGYYLDVDGGWDANYNGGNVKTYFANESDAQKWKLERQIPGDILPNSYVDFAEGDYIIRSAIGERVLDLDAGRLDENGGNFQIWEPLGVTNQIYHVAKAGDAYRISSKASGKSLDAEGGSGATIANVLQWDNYDNGPNQTWLFQDAGDGWVYIRNKNGFYLDVSGGHDGDYNGGNVQAWVGHGGDAQKWKVVRVSGKPSTLFPDGDYLLRSAVGDKALDVPSASTEVGTYLHVWKTHGGPSQIFRVGQLGALNANNIRLAQAGNEDRWLDKYGGDGTGGVCQWTGNGGHGQNWYFEEAGGGWYYIRNICGYYLDVEGGKDANGTNVLCWDFNGSNAQKWKLERPTVAYASVSSMPAQTYAGKAFVPEPMVACGSKTLRKGTDYTISYANNVNAGTASVTVKGKGYYAGTKVATFSIKPRSVTVTAKAATKTYGAKDPALTATVTGLLGKDKVSYSVGRKAGENVGSYAVTPTGAARQGNYQLSFKGAALTITPASISAATVSGLGAQAHTGKALTPRPTITFNGKALREGADYVLSYKNNVNIGTATVTITGKGNFSGTRSSSFQIAAASQPAASSSWQRLWGQGALDTAAAVVRAGGAFADGRGGTVVIATSDGYWDALAASGLAGTLDAPVVITAPGSLSPQAAAEIRRLRPSRALVMGGSLAISDACLAQVRSLVPDTRRVFGQAATDTAVEIYRAGSGWGRTAVVATSGGYWDALSVAPYAWAKRAPIFLTGGDNRLGASALSAIRSGGFTRVVIVGGALAVSSDVERQLSGIDVTRLWGQGALDTSAAIARWELSEGMSLQSMGVATADGYWDALAGAALCGKGNSVLVLVLGSDCRAFDAVCDRSKVRQGWVFGGEMAVSRAAWDHVTGG